jgi:hypothetical protein
MARNNKRASGDLDREQIFDEEPGGFLWCLHCGRTYRWAEHRKINGMMCPYDGCDGHTVFDGWPWKQVRAGNPGYPKIPKRGHVYELYRTRETIADEFERFHRISKYSGGLLPQTQAAVVLGLSKQRVNALVAAGRLHEHDFFGKNFIAGADIARFKATERRNGRPKALGKNGEVQHVN